MVLPRAKAAEYACAVDCAAEFSLPASISAPTSSVRGALTEWGRSLSMLTPAAMTGAETREQTVCQQVEKHKTEQPSSKQAGAPAVPITQTVTGRLRVRAAIGVSSVAWQDTSGERGRDTCQADHRSTGSSWAWHQHRWEQLKYQQVLPWNAPSACLHVCSGISCPQLHSGLMLAPAAKHRHEISLGFNLPSLICSCSVMMGIDSPLQG